MRCQFSNVDKYPIRFVFDDDSDDNEVVPAYSPQSVNISSNDDDDGDDDEEDVGLPPLLAPPYRRSIYNNERAISPRASAGG